MKILRIYYSLPPKTGGMEKHIYHLSKVQNLVHQVSIFYNYGVPVSSDDVRIFKWLRLYKFKPRVIGVTLFYIGILLELVFNPRKFDVIHIHGDWSSLMFLGALRRLTHAKVTVFSNHGQITTGFQHTRLLPTLLKDVDLVFSTGNDSAERISKSIKRKVYVQPSGINDIYFESCGELGTNEKFTVITVANLYPVKNLKLVLDIANSLKEIEFVIIGEGPERSTLQKLIDDSRINNVRMLGFQEPKMLKQIFCNADCFLLTSFAEGTPTSVLEAMACGLPIVSSNAGGLQKIVKDFENGFVISDFSKKDYLKKINLLKEDSELRTRISLENMKKAQNFSWDKVAGNITSISQLSFDEKN